MDAQTSVNAGAGEADEDTELGRCPLRIGCVAVAAIVIIIGFLDCQKLNKGQLLASGQHENKSHTVVLGNY